MSQAARPDLFRRSKSAPKPTLRQRVSRGVIGLAAGLGVWGFGLWSAAQCLLFARDVWNGGMQEFLHASVGSLSFSAVGLHYEGQWGAMLAGGQGLGVLLGLGLTLSPAAGLRRMGSLLLMAWAGLWLAGGVSLAREVIEPEQVMIASATGLAFLATLIYSARVWADRKPGKGKQ